jgi:hypothetical protein
MVQLEQIEAYLQEGGTASKRANLKQNIGTVLHSGRKNRIYKVKRHLELEKKHYVVTDTNRLLPFLGIDFNRYLYTKRAHGQVTDGSITGRKRNTIICNEANPVEVVLNFSTIAITIKATVVLDRFPTDV